MRNLLDLIEASQHRLSFADAKSFLTDLEHAKGRIAQIARENPWLIGYCQEAAQDRLGASFSVFRGLTLTHDLRADAVASTSLNWEVAYDIIDTSPGMVFTKGKTLISKKALLHYKITPANIVMWIPVALEFVKQGIGKRTNHNIEDRYGEKRQIAKLLRAVEEMDEQEIVADLNGLTPKVIMFESNLIGGEKKAVFREFMRGTLDLSDPAGWAKKNRISFLDEDEIAELAVEYQRWRA
jgi:hypothetical protein